MKTKILLVLLLGWVGVVCGQEKISNDDRINVKEQFVLDYYVKGTECLWTDEGDCTSKGKTIELPLNAAFIIVGQIKSNYVIKFFKWPNHFVENNLKYYYMPIKPQVTHFKNEQFDLNTGKTIINNEVVILKEKENDTIAKNTIGVVEKYFLIKKSDLISKGSIYHRVPKYQSAFGTITYLLRIRPSVKDISSTWSTDLNLGIAYGVKRNFNKNWGIAVLGGLSISKIRIDSLSTSPSINKTVEKVSFSPTLNILGNYKKFFIGVGIGLDWVNLDSEEAKKWVYNKKPFYAIGLGINIFSENDGDTNKASNAP